jgi:hypothetical protein
MDFTGKFFGNSKLERKANQFWSNAKKLPEVERMSSAVDIHGVLCIFRSDVSQEEIALRFFETYNKQFELDHAWTKMLVPASKELPAIVDVYRARNTGYEPKNIPKHFSPVDSLEVIHTLNYFIANSISWANFSITDLPKYAPLVPWFEGKSKYSLLPLIGAYGSSERLFSKYAAEYTFGKSSPTCHSAVNEKLGSLVKELVLSL